jgi:outer membrane lipase/esterase
MLFKRFHDGIRALFLPLILSLPLLATAGPFSNLYIFGDSLSDTGNLLGTGTTRPLPFAGPYMGDRFSNGPLWVEHLAQGLGLSPQAAAPFIYGGNNFAFAGAQTGIYPAPPADQIPGILAQVGGIWAPTRTGPTDANALYVVVAGGNDMRDARSVFTTNSLADVTGRQQAAVNAITNLANTLGLLAQLGAKNILVATLPDLGITPEAALTGLQAASTDATNRFNALVPLLMGTGASFGLNMNLLDIYGITSAIQANPAAYGITDISNPCLGFVFSIGTSCAQSAFSDILHPTALVHALIGREALAVFGIPEPGTVALFALALLAMVVARRKAVRTSRQS